MRNLKKILALALALVMSLSLMTAANAFTDDSSIDATYAEAVEVLSGLKVFKGTDDGSTFAPKQSITRAEVAAILYRIVTGDVTDAQAGIYVDYNKFEDVASTAWYAGYVNYCANAELIVGDGTNFYPTKTVTGYEALAMILRAVGYDVNDEFKGASWQIQVASTAKELGITDTVLTGTLGTAASREVVAELLFRTLAYAPIVKWTTAFGYQSVTLSATGGLVSNQTLGMKTFGLAQSTTAEMDAWGRPSYNWTAEKPTAVAGVVATIEQTPVATYTTGVDGCTLLKALGYAETNYTNVTFTTYTNGVGTGHVSSATSAHNTGICLAATSHTYGAQGRLMEVYAMGTASYRVVYVDTYLAKIGTTTTAITSHTAVDSVALTVYEANSTGTAKTYTYATGTAAYTEDAYALVTMADGVVKSVTEIAPAATAVGAYWLNTATGDTTIVGGVTYNDADKFFVGQGIWDVAKTWNVYTDSYGNIIGLVEYVAPNTYAYGVISAMKWVDTNDLLSSGYVLSNIVKMDSTTMANTILADNTLTTEHVFSSNGALLGDYAEDKVSETTQYNDDAYGDTLFQYTLNANGSYNITAKAHQVSGAVDIKAGVSNLWIADGVAMATNDNTVYLVKTGTAAAPVYTTYTGYKNVPSMNNVTVEFLTPVGTVYTDYVFVDATAATYDGAAGLVWFAGSLTQVGTNASGDPACIAYIDGIATVVYVDANNWNSVNSAVTGLGLYMATRNADGDITAVTKLWTSAFTSTGATYRVIGNVTGVSGTVITNSTDDGSLNMTGAAVYSYDVETGVIVPVAKVYWDSLMVGNVAYCVIGNDGIVDAIYVPATPVTMESLVGGVYFDDLGDAVTAATAGDTIQMTADVEVDATLVVDKSLTIDLNGYTLKSTGDNTDVIKVTSGDVVIKGEGNVKATGTNAYCVWACGGNVTINNGTFTSASCATIYVSTANTITINGGTFEAAATYNGRYWVLNVKNSANNACMVVKGGTFKNFDPSDPNTDDKEGYLASGYSVIEKEVAPDTWYTVVATEAET